MSAEPPRAILGTVTTPATPAKPDASNQGGFRKLGLDLLFTLVIPNLLLGKTFPTLNFGFKDLVGSNVTTYVVAALVPVTYTLIDLARSRKFNPVTVLAGSSAMIGGALAFLQVSGAAFALKDSYGSIFLAFVMGGSLLIGRPFFRVFFQAILMPENDRQRSLLARMWAHPAVKGGLVLGTLVIFLEAVAMGGLNFYQNLRIVKDTFGTDTFNEQVASVNLIMRVPSIVTSLGSFALAFYLVQQGVSKAYGGKVSLFDDGFFTALENAEAEPNATGPQGEPQDA